jgi:hypothetical protein
VAESEGSVNPDATTHVVPCRPTVSCTADFASPGTLEVELGYQFARTSDYAATRSFPFLIKLTLSKLLQFQLGSNGITVPPSPGSLYFDNLLLGAKLHIADQGKILPSIAFTALIGIPNYQYLSVFVTGHASKDIGPLHVDLNAGISEIGLDLAQAVNQGFVALALSTSLPATLGAAVEGYYFSDAQAAGSPVNIPHDGGVRLVLTTTPRPWLVFDMGGDVGFFPSTRAFSVFFGMSIAPIVFWRERPKPP